VLVGTDHSFQRAGSTPAGEQFFTTIRNLCVTHGVRAIAEEMNFSALSEHGVMESIGQQVSVELGLKHEFADPSREERAVLGISQENDIRAQGWLNRWPEKRIDAAISESDRIREREWLRRIEELNRWPLLFICGSDHFIPFARLLRENGMNVFEAFQDWASN
jgi:hypothetical protein